MQTAEDQDPRAGPDQLADRTSFVPVPMMATPPESGFGERVKAARTHYRLNVEALSRLTKTYDQPEGRGVSGAAISRYEAGEALPGAREFRLIAESLGLSPDWLLFGTIRASGSTPGQQKLIAALRQFIGEEQVDASVAGVRQSEWSEFAEQAARLQRIAEARRP